MTHLSEFLLIESRSLKDISILFEWWHLTKTKVHIYMSEEYSIIDCSLINKKNYCE